MTVRIGDQGKTSTVLRPGGFVTVGEVRHPARSVSGFIDISTAVIVVGGDNLGLVVRTVDSTVAPVALPGTGEIVYSSFGSKVAVTGAADELRRAARRRHAIRRSWLCGGLCGFVCAGVGAFQMQPAWQTLSPERPWLFVSALIVCVSVCGLAVGRVMYAAFEQVENHPSLRFTYVATCLTLAGSTAVLAYVMPRRGAWVGGTTALCTTVVLGAAFPVLAMVGEWLSGPGSDGTAEAGAAEENDTH